MATTSIEVPRRWIISCIVLLLTAVTAISVAGLSASKIAHAAASKPPWYCDGLGTIDEFGKDIPLVLVHGILGKPSDWTKSEDSPFEITLKTAQGAKIAQKFGYTWQGNGWVTQSNTGPRLARLIICLGRWSKENGGPGKVMPIGHSMGGLAIQYALGQTVDGHKVSDFVDKMTTIATPYQGSFAPIAPLFLTKGSKALRDLPRLPSTLSVYAIAGNVHDKYYDKGSNTPYRDNARDDDLWVGIESATANQQWNARFGGGAKVFDCDYTYICTKHRRWFDTIKRVKLEPNEPFCQHENQLKSQVIANEVKLSIERYTGQLARESASTPTASSTPSPTPNAGCRTMASVPTMEASGAYNDLPTRPGDDTVCVGSLQLTLPDPWFAGGDDAHTSALAVMPPDPDPGNERTTIMICEYDATKTDRCGKALSSTHWQPDTQNRAIDGVMSSRHWLRIEKTISGLSFGEGWCFDDKQVCIDIWHYSSSGITNPAAVRSTIDSVLATAKWN